MAQSAKQKRTPIDIEPFWEKPTADPPLKWENWQLQANWLFLREKTLH